jgi:hypothetical protein
MTRGDISDGFLRSRPISRHIVTAASLSTFTVTLFTITYLHHSHHWEDSAEKKSLIKSMTIPGLLGAATGAVWTGSGGGQSHHPLVHGPEDLVVAGQNNLSPTWPFQIACHHCQH